MIVKLVRGTALSVHYRQTLELDLDAVIVVYAHLDEKVLRDAVRVEQNFTLRGTFDAWCSPGLHPWPLSI